jgi:hypothetical protein
MVAAIDWAVHGSAYLGLGLGLGETRMGWGVRGEGGAAWMPKPEW